MASLTKDSKGRSNFWICCYTTADGRRLKKSTKTKNRKDALEFCLSLERTEHDAKAGTLTETRARELIGEIVERSTGRELDFHSVESWFRLWFKDQKTASSPATNAAYLQMVELFLSHLGERAKLTIAAATSEDIISFRDAQLATGKNPNTVRGLLKKLRIPFGKAFNGGKIKINPTKDVAMPPKARNEERQKPQKGTFTTADVEALMRAAVSTTKDGKAVFKAGDEWRGLILMAYLTGARLQDLANLKWEKIDLKKGTMDIPVGKSGGDELEIPIHPALAQHLREIPRKGIAKAPVFPTLANRSTGGKSGLSMAFSRIMARAGVISATIYSPKEGGEGRAVRSLTFHSLRHSFNTAMANAGVAQETRQKLTGHQSAAMNTGYTHLELDVLRKALEMVPSPGNQKGTK